MTTKLTLTIDDSVISSAKKYAKRKNTSVSDIVENYLKSITVKEDKTPGISPRVLKLMGSIRLPDDFDYKKELGNVLAKKYRK
jgi:hypothetical protein